MKTFKDTTLFEVELEKETVLAHCTVCQSARTPRHVRVMTQFVCAISALDRYASAECRALDRGAVRSLSLSLP